MRCHALAVSMGSARLLHRGAYLRHRLIVINDGMVAHALFGHAAKPQGFISQPLKFIGVPDEFERCFDLLPRRVRGDRKLIVGEGPKVLALGSRDLTCRLNPARLQRVDEPPGFLANMIINPRSHPVERHLFWIARTLKTEAKLNPSLSKAFSSSACFFGS